MENEEKKNCKKTKKDGQYFSLKLHFEGRNSVYLPITFDLTKRREGEKTVYLTFGCDTHYSNKSPFSRT